MTFDPRNTDEAFVARACRYLDSVNGHASRRDRAAEADFLLHCALRVVGDLRARGRPTVPERPLSCPDDDHALREALRRAERARIPSVEDRTLLCEHGEWRAARWRAEHEGAGRALELLCAARNLEKLATDPVVLAAREEIAAFLLSEWGYALPLETPAYFQARDIADKLARMPRTVPGARVEERPRWGREESGDGKSDEW